VLLDVRLAMHAYGLLVELMAAFSGVELTNSVNRAAPSVLTRFRIAAVARAIAPATATNWVAGTVACSTQVSAVTPSDAYWYATTVSTEIATNTRAHCSLDESAAKGSTQIRYHGST